ncbi:hypothetical protein BGX34_007316 [Mortierella sp. NVP85]|nr:hypothetical protein BGX34_007316 [Mortierella sp. NVP85]
MFSVSTRLARPKVAIVGAGLGGLMLGQLLEQINVPYHIYERAKVVKPLGTAMALGPSVLPIFEQLSLLDDVKSFSLPCYSVNMYDENIEKLGSVDMTDHDTLLGSHSLIFSRPRLYDLMLSRVPAHKVSHGIKVLRTEEKDGKVHIYCSDNTTHEADILVGADGAYSTVRQTLYQQLDEQGLLPKSDLERLSIASLNMVGTAVPEDPDKYPQLKDKFCNFAVAIGGSGGRSARERQFSNAEWGPESIDAMYKEFENDRCPFGGTMGDIMKYTPKDMISKVFLEEKNFTTWYGGRTVLLGDGAVNAMHDAVVLANCIYNMTDTTSEGITAAFKEYYDQRHPRLDAQIKRSQSLSALMGGETWYQRLSRHVALNYMPKFILESDFIRSMEYRPQIAWLPLVPNRGRGHVLPQEGKRELLQDRIKRLQEEEQQQ